MKKTMMKIIYNLSKQEKHASSDYSDDLANGPGISRELRLPPPTSPYRKQTEEREACPKSAPKFDRYGIYLINLKFS